MEDNIIMICFLYILLSYIVSVYYIQFPPSLFSVTFSSEDHFPSCLKLYSTTVIHSRCTSIAWMPGGDGNFVVAHADGNLYVYDKVG